MKTLKVALLSAVLVLAAIYGRWIVSDLLWLHEQRMAAERQAAFVAGQQDAVRQLQQAQTANKGQ